MKISLSGVSPLSSGAGIESEHVRVLILGSGPAGLSAALYAARADLNPVVLAGMEMGGQVALTYTVENYPGFPEGVGGQELVELFQKQAERFGARIDFDLALEVNLRERPFVIKAYSKTYLADTLIIATGATPNHLNVPGEKELTGKGVSYCATCDGWFFKDKDVVVVGGGDSALEEGIFLTRYARSVAIVHRRDTLRAGAILQKRARENSKISFLFNTIVTEIIGQDAVRQVRLRNVQTGEEWLRDTDGVFIFIGHSPNTQLFEGQLEMDANRYLIVDRLMQTNIPGVFAAGEAADPYFRQVITSAGMGAAAAMRAIHYLQERSAEKVSA
ncbi:MAG: thioredoxin-disulfide reductase [Anaerolineales bacterium]|nr:thioredoxin-disulfide reductase [Anaerolineales bacterium]MDW8160619.1 thioredoxin-disulfide reductase [Anaerolineales bacterium]